jgi:hypothetical protein
VFCAAIILDLVAVIAPILAYVTLGLAFANEDFASVAPVLLVILIGVAALAGPIAVLVVSAILTVLIVGGVVASLRPSVG